MKLEPSQFWTEAFANATPAEPSRGAAWRSVLPRAETSAMRVAITPLMALGDFFCAFGAMVTAGYAYHLAVYDAFELPDPNVRFAVLAALLFIAPGLVKRDYSPQNVVSRLGDIRANFARWTMAFAATMAVAVLTKSGDELSRVALVLFFSLGFGAVVLVRSVMIQSIIRSQAGASALVRRAYLVGYEADIAAFERHNAGNTDIRVIGMTVLRKPEGDGVTEVVAEDLALAVSTVRLLRPDDLFLLIPWSDANIVEHAVNAFLRVPAAIHLRPEQVLGRIPTLKVDHVGSIPGINVSAPSLTVAAAAAKRAFDLTASLVGLLLLSPLFLLVGLLIKLDSPGPVFFRQRRYGFNQEPFRIWKFRTMRVAEDRQVRQATKNDPRITRIGRFLRRFNIDELPQLLNVISGHMSLVGPRPHALEHDRAFETRIALYARRHNVKPGITGWAQINGYRGETATDDRMRLRVEHDLYYIDNWSFWLDLKILVLTVVSPKAYRNAL